MKLIFGANTDSDTFGMVFGHMIGYIIAVNGVDIQLEDLWSTDMTTGLLGLEFDEETGEGIPGKERFFAWDDIESVEIY